MFQFVNLQSQETFPGSSHYPQCSKPVHLSKGCHESTILGPEPPKILHQLTTRLEQSGELVSGNTFRPENCAGRETRDVTKNIRKGRAKGEVDTSSFSIEERLVAAVWVHERARMRLSIGQIKRDFKQRFDKEPPTKNTLLIWEKKLFATGNVMDAKRSGRPCQRKEHIAAVQASVSQSPGLSLRARAAALALPRTTLRTILSDDLRLDRRVAQRPRAAPARNKPEKPPETPKVNKPKTNGEPQHSRQAQSNGQRRSNRQPPSSRQPNPKHQPPTSRQPQLNRQPQANHQPQTHLPQPVPVHNPPPNHMNYHGYGELVVPMHMPEFQTYVSYPNHGENKAVHQPSIALEHPYMIGSQQGTHVMQ